MKDNDIVLIDAIQDILRFAINRLDRIAFTKQPKEKPTVAPIDEKEFLSCIAKCKPE